MGCDLSLTGAAFVVLDTGTGAVAEKMVVSTPAKDNLFDRISTIASMWFDLYEAYAPVATVLEDYGFSGKQKDAAIKTISLGGCVRYMLRQRKMDYHTCPPNTLKSFCTGAGNSPKEKVMMEVYKRWGFEPKDNNEADAYVLAQLALRLAGHAKSTKADLANLAKVLPVINSA